MYCLLFFFLCHRIDMIPRLSWRFVGIMFGIRLYMCTYSSVVVSCRVVRVVSAGRRVGGDDSSRVGRSGRLVILLSVEGASRPRVKRLANSEVTIFPTARLPAANPRPPASSRVLCQCASSSSCLLVSSRLVS